MSTQPDLVAKLDAVIAALTSLQADTAELKEENRQLRVDLLKHTASGWQDPLTVARALGFVGRDDSVIKKMHRLRTDGTFGRPGRHYRAIGKGARPTYQYHIENCDKALNKHAA
ncbi:MAG: hypothetical protein AAGA46_00040 [Cyanobacteria bacterium P01_F01_bin.13]